MIELKLPENMPISGIINFEVDLSDAEFESIRQQWEVRYAPKRLVKIKLWGSFSIEFWRNSDTPSIWVKGISGRMTKFGN